ncbi:hypothetical protein NC651_013161 [Populus alba x Populus x berolinensis]|nr:hypothetical protein NC651_013161 [Populus alba x Populus x berolinensis]
MYIHGNKKKGFQELKLALNGYMVVMIKKYKQKGIFSQSCFEILATSPLYIMDKGNSDGIFCSDTFV